MAKRIYEKRSLGKEPIPPAIPLIVKGNYKYDLERNELHEQTESKSSDLQLVPEAIDLLKSIGKPIAVVAICGPYRTGKSYFLSRFIGVKNCFQVGHTTNVCTHGIWMGTTVLECDDFTLVFLDTEGIDAVSGTAPTDASILVMTILLSSYLIYNSIRVPTKSDLEKLSCFTKLSESITIRSGEDSDMVDFRDHFPSFLWLLRDATLKPVSETDVEISPTEYLKTQVLCRSKKRLPCTADIVAMAILGYFPTIECQTLPQPSADKDILQHIAEHQEKLSDEFNVRIEEVIRFILENVSAKKGFTDISVDGSTLVLLAQGYITEINKPGSILSLECSWHTMVNLKLKEIQENLVAMYKREMEAALTGKAPLEEYPTDGNHCKSEALMQIHERILNPKRKILQDEMKRLMPPDIEGIESLQEQRKVLMAEFERRIVEYEEVEHDSARGEVITRTIVKGGILHSFVQRNKQNSHEFCAELFDSLFQPIQELISALSPDESITFGEFSCQIDAMLVEYRSKAIGPAIEEVYQMKSNDVLKHCTEMFQKIQGINQQTINALHEADAARIQVNKLNEVVKQRENELARTKLEHQMQTTQYIIRVDELQKRSDQKLQDELKKQRELFDAKMKEAAEQSESKIADMERIHADQMARFEEDQKKAAKDYKAQIATLQQDITRLLKQKIEDQRRLETLEEELKNNIDKANAKAEEARAEADKANAKAQEAQDETAALRKRYPPKRKHRTSEAKARPEQGKKKAEPKKGQSSCFAAGTVVTLSDGNEIPIEKQTSGLKILAHGGEITTITAEFVENTLPAGDQLFGINDDTPFASVNHPFWTTEGWKCLDPEGAKQENPDVDFKLLQVGDVVFKIAQTNPLLYEPIRISKLIFRTLSEPTKIYGLHLDGPRSYHANRYVVAANYPVLTKKRVHEGMKSLNAQEKQKLASAITSARNELTKVLGSWANSAFEDMGLVYAENEPQD